MPTEADESDYIASGTSTSNKPLQTPDKNSTEHGDAASASHRQTLRKPSGRTNACVCFHAESNDNLNTYFRSTSTDHINIVLIVTFEKISQERRNIKGSPKEIVGIEVV